MSHGDLACPACGYSLRTLSIPCPLCEVDPIAYARAKESK